MKGPIYDGQLKLFGHKTVCGFGEQDLYVKEMDRDLANHLIRTNHYSGKVYNATYIHLGIYINQYHYYSYSTVWYCTGTIHIYLL